MKKYDRRKILKVNGRVGRHRWGSVLEKYIKKTKIQEIEQKLPRRCHIQIRGIPEKHSRMCFQMCNQIVMTTCSRENINCQIEKGHEHPVRWTKKDSGIIMEFQNTGSRENIGKIFLIIFRLSHLSISERNVTKCPTTNNELKRLLEVLLIVVWYMYSVVLLSVYIFVLVVFSCYIVPFIRIQPLALFTVKFLH